jgi:hypothetical protein
MVNLASDYGGDNAIANRQAAIARYPTGAAGSGVFRPSPAAPPPTPRITAGPSGRYSRPAPPPTAAPGPINTDPNAWLGSDTGYQDQLRQLGLALSNFNADVTRKQGDINTDYGTSEHAAQGQKVLDLKNLEADYAGRGLIHSGLYANSVGDYNKEFEQRLADLVSSRDRALSQLTQEQNQFSTQQQLNQQAAREAALRRRASSLGGVV